MWGCTTPCQSGLISVAVVSFPYRVDELCERLELKTGGRSLPWLAVDYVYER